MADYTASAHPPSSASPKLVHLLAYLWQQIIAQALDAVWATIEDVSVDHGGANVVVPE